MVNPKFAENTIEEFVKNFGPIGVRNLSLKTGYKKPIINSILHKNKKYQKIYQSPLSTRNKKTIWKFRVMSPVDVPKDDVDESKDGAPPS